MTTSSKPDTLYDRDFNLWLEQAIAQLKCGNWQDVDIENVIIDL